MDKGLFPDNNAILPWLHPNNTCGILILDKTGLIVDLDDPLDFFCGKDLVQENCFPADMNFFDLCKSQSMFREKSHDIVYGLEGVFNKKEKVYAIGFPCQCDEWTGFIGLKAFGVDVMGEMHIAVVLNYIENYKSYEYTQNMIDGLSEQNEEITSFMDSMKLVLKNENFRKTARGIFDICKRITGATAGYVALLSSTGEENEVLFLDAGGAKCSVDPSLPMPIRGLRGETYRTGKAVYNNDFSGSEWTKYMPEGHVGLKNVLFAPLTIEGKVVGLLGLANKKEDFNDRDAKNATMFGDLAAIALYNNRTLERLKSSNDRFRSVVQTANDAIITIDSRGAVVFWNKTAVEMFGFSEREAIGNSVQIIIPESFRVKHLEGMENIMNGGKPAVIGKTVELYAIRKNGSEFPVELSLARWESDGNAFFTGILRDITERKDFENRISTSLAEKEILLQEVHHRVKNNLQLIISILKLQYSYVSDNKNRVIFNDCINRIQSMSIVHNMMYGSQDLSRIDLKGYLDNLLNELFNTYSQCRGKVDLEYQVGDVDITIKRAIPCGLILNELLSNILKHAFPPEYDGRGKIYISIEGFKGDGIEIIVSDNGVGLPPGLDIRKSKSLGMKIIYSLVEVQLEGKVKAESDRNGTRFIIII